MGEEIMITGIIVLSALLFMSSVSLFLEKLHSKVIHEQNWKLHDRVCYLEGTLKRLLEASREDYRALVEFHATQAGLTDDEELLTPDDIRLLKKLQKSFSADVYVSVEKLFLASRKLQKKYPPRGE
jgi:hypothetical protein